VDKVRKEGQRQMEVMGSRGATKVEAEESSTRDLAMGGRGDTKGYSRSRNAENIIQWNCWERPPQWEGKNKNEDLRRGCQKNRLSIRRRGHVRHLRESGELLEGRRKRGGRVLITDLVFRQSNC